MMRLAYRHAPPMPSLREPWYKQPGMARGLLRRLATFAALAALACRSVAHAAPGEASGSSPRFKVVVEENGDCSGEPFTTQLLRRAPSARVAGPSETALEIGVRLQSEPGVVRGRLTLQETNGFVTQRDVTGASCAEVTAALALIAAIFLEPNATMKPPSGEARPPEPIPDAREPRQHWTLAGGPAVAVHGSVAPGLTPAAELVFQAEFDSARVWSPLFRVSLVRALTKRIEVRTSVAALRFTAGRLGVCPLEWPAGGTLALRPCGTFEAGVLDAEGTETSDPRSVRTAWLAPGALLHVELNPLRMLAITLQTGLVVPLLRPEFYFDPDTPETVAFEVPPIGGTGNIGLLLRFW